MDYMRKTEHRSWPLAKTSQNIQAICLELAVAAQELQRVHVTMNDRHLKCLDVCRDTGRQQLSRIPHLGGYDQNGWSLAVVTSNKLLVVDKQSLLMGTQISLNRVMFHNFWLSFCLLLGTEMVLFFIY